MVSLDTSDNPRENLWQELEHEAQIEAKQGDGRALRVLHRLRAKIEPYRLPPSLHEDNGAWTAEVVCSTFHVPPLAA